MTSILRYIRPLAEDRTWLPTHLLLTYSVKAAVSYLGDVASGESLEPFRPPSRAAAGITVSPSSRHRRRARTGTTSLGTHDLPRLVRAGRTGRARPERSRRCPTVIR